MIKKPIINSSLSLVLITILLTLLAVVVSYNGNMYYQDHLVLNDVQKMKRTVAYVKATNKKGVSTGSGVVLSPNGIVITNTHVIKDSESIIVQVGTIFYKAKIIFTEKDTDLTYLKIEPKEALHFASIKPYGTYMNPLYSHGDEVYTIGNPLGIKKFVGKGIISKFFLGKERQVYIGTDSVILEGSSGGALFSSDGKLIGITTWRLKQDKVHDTNIGVAISSNEFYRRFKVINHIYR